MTRAPFLVALALAGIALLTGCGESSSDDGPDAWSQITSREAEDQTDVSSPPFDSGAPGADVNVVTIQTAEVGQCVEKTSEANLVSLLESDCDEVHDAEVIVVGDLTDDELATYATDVAAVCETRLSDDGGDPAELSGDSWQLLTQEIPPSEGDTFVCLVEDSDGSKLPAE